LKGQLTESIAVHPAEKNTGKIGGALLILILFSTSSYLPFIKDDTLTISKTILFVFFLGLLMLILSVRLARAKFLFSVNDLDILVALFLLFCTLNGLFHSENLLSSKTVELLGLVIFYAISKTIASRTRSDEAFVLLVILLLLVQVSVATLQWNELMPSFNHNFKFSGFYNNPGPFAIYLAILISAGIVVVLTETRQAIRATTIILIFLAVFFLFVTGSRASWLGLSCALIFLLLTRVRQIAFKTLTARIVAAALVFCALIVGNYLYSLKKDSADGRLLIWRICMRLVREHPIRGVGVEDFPSKLFTHQASYFLNQPNRVKEQGRLAGEPWFAFNDMLQITGEQGIIGLILFLILITKVYLVVRKQMRDANFKTQLSINIASTTLIVILVGGLFSYPLSLLSFQILFFGSIGLISARTRLLCRNRIVINRTRKLLSPPALALLISGCLFVSFAYDYYRSYRAWKVAESEGVLKKQAELLAARYRVLRQDSWFNLVRASYFYSQKNYNDAIEIIHRSAIRCASSNVYYTLGACYESIGEFDKASDVYLFLRNALPDHVRPRYLLAMMHHKKGDYKRFEAAAKEVVMHEPKIRSNLTDAMKKKIIEIIQMKTPLNQAEK
jgi:O-antigen ligase